MPPPKVQGLLEFIWNGEEKKFLGRNGLSWLKITIFYIIFYACLIAFWAVCLIIFLQTVSLKSPKWTTNTNGIIGSNPGLGFRPRPREDNIESTLVMFRDGPGENWDHWVSELNSTVQEYKELTDHQKKNKVVCDYSTKLKDEQFCQFRVGDLGSFCTLDQNFGYEAGKPCIIVKLNKIYGWSPQLYANADDLPEHMPPAARQQIIEEFTDPISGNFTEQNVWITCEGENPADVENIGDVRYYPQPGMPTYYYPFSNTEGYQSPLVAVEFSSIRKGVLVNVECKAWAKNIKHDRKMRRGSVHLEIMVD